MVRKLAVHRERERAQQTEWARTCTGLRRQLSWALSKIRTKARGPAAHAAK